MKRGRWKTNHVFTALSVSSVPPQISIHIFKIEISKMKHISSFFFVCCLFVCIVKTCAWPHVADRLTEEDAKSVRSCVRTVLHVVDLAEIFKRFIFAKYFEIKKRLPRGFLRILEIKNPEWVCVCVCITVKENRVSGSGPPVSQVHALERQISKTFSRYTLR